MRLRPAFDVSQPWPWPSEFRDAVENYLVRPFGPNPKRPLPPDTRSAAISQVVSTKDELDRLVADKLPLWAWAMFASSLLQQRNSVVARLRDCAAGYQPGPGAALSGRAYAELARQTMQGISEQSLHLNTFLGSPAYTAVMKDVSSGGPADPNAIRFTADRLMRYHDNFLTMAERCLSTPVVPQASVLALDTSAMAVCPLVGFGHYIVTLCLRIAETRELLPYSGGRRLQVENAHPTIAFPHGLQEHVLAQIGRFSG